MHHLYLWLFFHREDSPDKDIPCGSSVVYLSVSECNKQCASLARPESLGSGVRCCATSTPRIGQIMQSVCDFCAPLPSSSPDMPQPQWPGNGLRRAWSETWTARPAQIVNRFAMVACLCARVVLTWSAQLLETVLQAFIGLW